MDGFDPATSFGPEVARRYDDSPRGDEAETVALLTELAGDGRALELAIGTGRIALPLAACGVRVDGIELSPDMVDRLRAKPGGDDIEVTMGDMARTAVQGTYSLVYLVFNTIFNLLTQDDQVRCFENVARHLTDDGSFVVEAGLPDFVYRLRNNQYVEAEAIEVGEVRLDVLRHDPATQMIDESHVTISPAGMRLNPVVQRYAWPPELDLMARIAGLRLRERWDGWNREPYTGAGRTVVSVWGR
jgi:SAM-dependent methyltransferase